MTRSRRVLLIAALILSVIVVAGRFLRQDARYLHAGHVSEAAIQAPDAV